MGGRDVPGQSSLEGAAQSRNLQEMFCRLHLGSRVLGMGPLLPPACSGHPASR